jgi:hypothetical protein
MGLEEWYGSLTQTAWFAKFRAGSVLYRSKPGRSACSTGLNRPRLVPGTESWSDAKEYAILGGISSD